MRAKLMGFIVLMVAVLLGLVWFLGVRSLGTFYEVGVRRELTRTLNAFCTVLDKAGLPGEAGYDDAALLAGLEENTGLLAGKCFEVADASGRLVDVYKRQPTSCQGAAPPGPQPSGTALPPYCTAVLRPGKAFSFTNSGKSGAFSQFRHIEQVVLGCGKKRRVHRAPGELCGALLFCLDTQRPGHRQQGGFRHGKNLSLIHI